MSLSTIDKDIQIKCPQYVKDNKFCFDYLVKDIYKEFPYLGFILANIKRYPNKNMNHIAEISVKKVLKYNPNKMAQLTFEEAKAVLLHEVLHIANKHFPRARYLFKALFSLNDPYGSYMSKADNELVNFLFPLMNITMDCAINQLISKRLKIPDSSITLEYLEKVSGQKLEAEREFEYYFAALSSKNKELLQDFLNKNSCLHEGQWEVTDEMLPEALEEFYNLLRKAHLKQREYESARGIGSDSSDSWMPLLPDPSFNVNDRFLWESLIRKSLGTIRGFDQKIALSKPNRRLYDNPFGKKRTKISKHVVIIFDTSSSLHKETLAKFLGIVKKATKRYKTTVEVLLTDTTVYKVYQNVQSFNRNDFEIHENGGTDLREGINWIRENKNFGSYNVIILTDGETPFYSRNELPKNISEIGFIYTEDHEKIEGYNNYAILYNN